jgi:hypothetical protein
MDTNEEEQIQVDPCVLVLDFIHANDNLVSETAEMGFVGGTVAAATPQRVGPAAAGRLRRLIFARSAIIGIVSPRRDDPPLTATCTRHACDDRCRGSRVGCERFTLSQATSLRVASAWQARLPLQRFPPSARDRARWNRSAAIGGVLRNFLDSLMVFFKTRRPTDLNQAESFIPPGSSPFPDPPPRKI